ncbi:arylsulfatase G-like [Neocloeon triangulifer]|uniref:arylsulfatase G-like n=1 Tax=Neocloeon triangulifer TaxID=2078957 RepID=UPI00286F4930|nr:arylsulfatase G-like [Neocloeon triangulifer]
MISLALLLMVCFACSTDGRQERPNIIVLVADDMGWGDLGANLPHLASSTPFLDNLANSGVRFQDFHSGASVCTPSRAALLTGRLGKRTGVVDNFVPDSVGGLPAEEITIAKMLKNAGYRTAAIGKWHLGLTFGHHPLEHGFDTYLGVPFSIDMGCTTPPGHDLPPKRSCKHTLENRTKSAFDTALPLYKDRNILHQPVKLSLLARYYKEFGVNFINRNRDKPFFLYVAFSHVHVPLAHGGNFNNASSGVLQNCIKEMDWIAEELVNTAGPTNTLVWFLSDNGPWEYKCSLAGSVGPYKGQWQKSNGGGSSAKTTLWEGGHRVPAFISWPSVLTGPVISDELVSALDLVPTISSLVGTSLPSHHLYDGQDISSIVLNNGLNTSSGHKILLHPSNADFDDVGAIGAVRVGHYKAVFHSGGVEGCGGQHLPPFQVHNPPLVFDLAIDPEEQFPLEGALKDAIADEAIKALQIFSDSLKVDNCSVVDYSTDLAVRPCCSHFLANCYCPWDELM